MKQRFKNIQILLIIAICFSILALPSYLSCANFSPAKFAPSELFFENPDHENGLPDSGESELKVSGPAAFLTVLLLDTSLSKFPSHSDFRALSLCQETSILRC
jgi:hypothetical protein